MAGTWRYPFGTMAPACTPKEPPGPEITLLRHGETEWSQSGRHTGWTDIELTAAGEEEASRLAGALHASFDAVLCSPMRRARRTAELAGLEPYEVVEDLREWDYGDLEGLTTDEIHQRLPGWSVWSGPWPRGEDDLQVEARADAVVRRLVGFAPGERIAVVSHGHFLRALAARWLGAPVPAGAWLALDTATLSTLGWEHANPVLRRWNLPGSPSGAVTTTT